MNDMDDIIDEVVAESENVDNLDEIIQAASAIVNSHDVPDEDDDEDDDQDDEEEQDRQMMRENMLNGDTPTRFSAPASSEEDNMDYDSDDDDDSKSNNSGSRGCHKKRLKGEVKRSHHNVLERKRRDLIKDSFTRLKDSVPTLSAERASRAQILKKAADFIQAQNQKNESSRAELKELIRKNAELESKINSVLPQVPIKKELTE